MTIYQKCTKAIHQVSKLYVLSYLLLILSLGKTIAQKPRLLKDISPEYTLLRPPFALPDESFPRELIPLNNKVVFIATEGVLINGETRYRTAMWVTDGTENGTERIMFWPEEQLEKKLINKFVINGVLYFYLYRIDDNRRVTIAQLWRSDGSTAGTYSLKTFEFTTLINSAISTFHQLNNQNYFVVEGELWRTNGTVAGTEKVISKIDFPRGFTFSQLTVLNNILYSVNAGELHRSNGTKEGIVQISAPNLGPPNDRIFHLRAMDNSLYIITKQLLTNREVFSLWRTDGTTAGTRKLVVLDDSPAPQNNYKTIVGEVLATEKKIYYTLERDSALPQELWVTDGTTQGTLKLTDLHKPSLFNKHLGLVNLNNKVFFIKEVQLNTYEFWVSDGTVNGNKRLPIVAGEFLTEDYQYFRLNPKQVKLYIPQKGLLVNSIYETDGTEAGTRMLFDAAQYTQGQKLRIEYIGNRIIKIGNKLVFGAEEYKGDGFTYDSKTGVELYVLDLPCTPPSRPAITGNITPCNGIQEKYSLSKPQQGEIYKWTVQGGRIVTNNNDNITVEWLESGQRTISVSATNDCTSSTATLGVLVKPSVPAASVIISVGGTLTLLPGTTVTLSVLNVAGQTYQWFRNGTIIVGATSRQYIADTAGEYSIMVTREGCSTTSLPVLITLAFQATISGLAQVCSGQSTTLMANPINGTAPYTYQWRLNGMIQPSTGNLLTTNISGSYTVTITDSQGLTAISSVFMLVQKPSPNTTISVSGSTSLIPGTSTVLSVSALTAQTYQWFRDGVAISGATGSSYTAVTGGAYTVTVVRDGCTATSASPILIALVLATEPVMAGVMLTVSPNPTNGQVRVVLTLDVPATVTFYLTDGSGRTLQHWSSERPAVRHDKQIDLTNTPSGIYVLQTEIEGQKVALKIVKQ